MKRIIPLCIAGLVSATALAQAPAASILAGFGTANGWKQAALPQGFSIRWQVVGNEIGIEVTAPFTGWIGMGLGAMSDGDMVVGAVDDATGRSWLSDMFARGRKPEMDSENGGVDNLRLRQAVQADGKTTIRFVRPLSTGDALDKAIIRNVPTRVIFAHGEKDDFAYHGRDGRFAVDLTF